MKTLSNKINCHHAVMQGTFWAGFCAIWGFISVFLLHKGFTNGQIGLINSLSLVFSILFQPLLASLADRSKWFDSRRIAISLMAFLLGVTAVLRLFGDTHWVIAVCFVLIGTSLQLMAPFFNAIVMAYELRGIPVNYGFGRGIGSGCYAAMSMGMGIVLTHRTPTVILPRFAVFLVLLLVTLITFRYPLPAQSETAVKAETGQLSSREILHRYPDFVLLLVASALLMASHNTINTYFIHVVNRIGQGELLMGTIVAISAFTELPSMALFPFFSSHFSTRTLLCLSALTFLVKAILVTVATSPVLLYVYAIIQFFEYGILQPSMVYYTARLLGLSNLIRGQSLYHIFSNGIGPALASLLCGVLLDHFGVTAMLLFLVACCVAGLVIVYIATKPKKDLEVFA